LTSVLPIILLFSFLEAIYGMSLGKRLMKIKLEYFDHSYGRSFLRNTLKYLPWQIGHTTTIIAIYSGTNALFFVLTILNVGIVLAYSIEFIGKSTYFPDRIAGAEFVIVQ
jgi:hypothetical protein